ncbi:hypothetical protein [uncultured Methanobrevibacter sp.]|uniref:hypothetical protein n=1 Tax=uncultured Methanobrevibacter sp. TaxID=253161 RepID=UPI0025D51D0C|nr:hypothetical protein [uncultured Methanobrevibacter sp.]
MRFDIMRSKNTKFVIDHFEDWNRKDEINHNNHLYKIIGAGPKAFKVLKFMAQEETTKPAWNQTFWNYLEMTEVGEAVISKVAKKLQKKSSEQSTLD